MSLASNISDAFTRVATEVKSLRSDLVSRTGDLTTLTTSAKTSLVAAINELRATVAAATNINDSSTTTTTTWSSSKINTTINAFAPAWSVITGKPTTFPPTIGTTASTAKAGNYVPAWGEVSGKPSFHAVATSGNYTDLTGTIPTSALPPLAINEVFTVANQSAMLALTAQRGDMAIRTDNGRTYVLSTDSSSTLADWKEVTAAGQVTSVAGKTGAVTVSKADVGLGNVDNTSDANKPISNATQTALNAKAVIGTTAGTAADAGAVGSTTTDFVAVFEAGLV